MIGARQGRDRGLVELRRHLSLRRRSPGCRSAAAGPGTRFRLQQTAFHRSRRGSLQHHQLCALRPARPAFLSHHRPTHRLHAPLPAKERRAAGPILQLPARPSPLAAHVAPGAHQVCSRGVGRCPPSPLLEWAPAEPVLGDIVRQHARTVQAGAHRLDARYLLDGGEPKMALKAYGRVLTLRPRFALEHWHRILFALLSLLGLGWLRPRALYRKIFNDRPILVTGPRRPGTTWVGRMLSG